MAPLLLAFLFLQFFQTEVDGGSDHLIRLGSSLVAGGPTMAWYSPSNVFAFGFCSQDGGFVVAIWLLGYDENTTVWTAYRDDPPLSPNATLELTHEGKLVLRSEQSGMHKIIAVNISFAVMNDTGNLVLYNKHTRIVWQSFDYPTDSMLQGQSLYGGSELVSSVSKTDYSSGRFRLKMQVDGNLVMYPVNTEDDSVNAYWASDTSGHTTSKIYLYLNGVRLLLINGSDSDIIKDLAQTESSYSISLIYRATLDDDGNFRLYSHSFNHSSNPSASVVWTAPDHVCDVKFCGVNSYCTTNDGQPYCVCLPGSDFVYPDRRSSGCKWNFTKAWCESGKENVTYYDMVMKEQLACEDHPYYRASSDNKEDCSQSCLEDCECDAAFFQSKGKYCEKHKYPLRYVKRDYDNRALYVDVGFFKKGNVSLSVQANESVNGAPVEASQMGTWVLVIVISIGFCIYACISLSLSGFFIFKYRLVKYKRLLESRALGLAEGFILRSYTYNELRKATDGFQQELGRGSFGTVYKGCFYKGKKAIAVKRLEKVVDEGEREFRAEMQVIGKTHHKNLVRLLGYCAEGTKRLLVYEYMSNGTLADLLFRSERLPDWCERMQIALDVARGILYLHEECEAPIIHCDIKPQNILMDDFWTAKISDFGLAKLLMPDQTKTFTMVRGTRGTCAYVGDLRQLQLPTVAFGLPCAVVRC